MDKEFIIKKFDNILENGFKVKLIEEKYLKAFSENDKVIKGIFLGSIDDLLTTNIIASINFKELEGILHPKDDLFSFTTINININKLLFNLTVGEDILNQLPINLDSEFGINKSCELVKQYTQKEAIPFFDYWKDIRDLLPFLETNDNGYIADLFSNDGFYKKVIIWKLCSHPKYNELVEEMLEIFNQELKESPKDRLLKKDYDKYIRILKTLEKTKPLYIWDEKYLVQKPYIREI